jgi:hypothetical protein
MPEPITIRLDRSEEPLLTRDQLADRLQVSKRQVELMEATGLPTIRFGNGGCLVRHSWPDVKEWLATETERHLQSSSR